jgi:uncharacterized hydrophobic protein (TIGR00271 family)
MSETAAAPRPDRRTTQQTLRDVANPATVKGAVAIAVGVAIVVLPGVTLPIARYAVGVGLVVIGIYDLWYSFTGRGDRGERSRPIISARGLVSLGFGLIVLLSRYETLKSLLVVLGIFLVGRGLISLVAGIFGGGARRSSRLTIAAAGIALGTLAMTIPSSLTEGIVITGAIGAIVVGAIVLAYGLRVGAPASADIDVTTASTSEILWDWISATDVGAEQRATQAEALYFEEPGRAGKLTAWWVMLLLSVSIATFAVLQDSTAVVIGAMLIAPLMTPILGLAGALVNGWRRRAGASALLVAAGVVAAVALAYVIAAWVPALVSFEANSQIVSRVSPTFLDMLIALAAGAAGAFATVNKRVSSSIAGVAIAVALVPPLGVVGVSLEAQQWDDAFGAFLLFMTNFVSIVLAAAGVFVLSGFAESARLRRKQREILSTIAPFGALALVILVPLVFTAEGILATATQQKTAQTVVAEWVGEDSEIRVVQVTLDSDEVTVALAGTESIPSPTDLQQQLTEALGQRVSLVIDYTPTAEITVDTDGEVTRDRRIDTSQPSATADAGGA